ncbi:hypothetical protein BH11PLA2_BH11PLA2_15690 [soil metagenome]
MHLYSYVVQHDFGFAPNPFGGYLTLATCKPDIRLHAKPKDYLIGTGSAKVGNNRLIYAAQVSNVITIEEYGSNSKFANKRPAIQGQWWRRHGDNIYVKINGKWTQRRNCHHVAKDQGGDLRGMNVLICKRFSYFGDSKTEIPTEFAEVIKKGPNCKKIDVQGIPDFIAWMAKLPQGRIGKPVLCHGPSLMCN